MKRQLILISIAATFSATFSASLVAAPGSLTNVPLFLSTPTQPNIFFLLDDSGSMHWSMPVDGVSSSAIIRYWYYQTAPTIPLEWRAWCPGANLLAYNPNTTYKPWIGNIPGTNTPFPDMADITRVRTNPLLEGTIKYTESNSVFGSYSFTINLSAAPVVTWTDNNGNGTYDAGECPLSYSDPRTQRADSLPITDTNGDGVAERTNFANWFAYYRTREGTAKAAVTKIVATSSARMGMATLHNHNSVGTTVKDMAIASNKSQLMSNVVKITSGGGTPLRVSLNAVGSYFSQSEVTPSILGIGSATSPILPASEGGECQQNFVLLMTDGQWNGGTPSTGHQDLTVDNNFVWPAHQDSTPNLLADVAMKWYKTDLSPSLANKVPVQSGSSTQNLDENNQQHLVTFGVAFGPTGTLQNGPENKTQSFTWPVATSNLTTTIDDLRHAAYNGRGKFLTATRPSELISELQNIVSDIESRAGSSSAVALNSLSLSSNSTLFYSGFNTSDWSGTLNAFSLDPNTGDISPTETWSASALLNARTNNNMINNRVIYTLGRNNNGTLFKWGTVANQPTASILEDLKVNPDESNDTTPFSNSKDRINYIRGDNTNNEEVFRDRDNRLGDIINSAPIYIPKNSRANPSRKDMVYVGANDGMLHGFSAASGEELIAYVPSSISSDLNNKGLHHLTELDYSHRYYVDGKLSSSDVFISKNGSSPSWRTALIGSLGGGGRGLFALDVTEPGNFNNNNTSAKSTVLWEFTEQNEPALGFTYSAPQVVQLNNNQWAVVTGNGYNSVGTDTAQLIIIFIEKGTDGTWDAGDHITIDTTVGNSANKNGLSSPALVDLDNDGKTDRIYAGDLLGNMWAFDLSSANSANWGLANGASPLFAAGISKPITMRPTISKPEATWISDSSSNTPNLMVYFGTGQYIATGDPANTDQQSFYGIWDYGTPVSANNLVEQTFLTPTVADSRLLSTNSVDYNSLTAINSGWFIDLPETGERVTVDAFELEGLVFFNTLTPANDVCSAGGSSWIMAVDKKTGGNPNIIAFDLNNDGILDINDSYAAGKKHNNGIASATAVLTMEGGGSIGYISGTGNGIPNLIEKLILPGGLPTGKRYSWKQLINN